MDYGQIRIGGLTVLLDKEFAEFEEFEELPYRVPALSNHGQICRTFRYEFKKDVKSVAKFGRNLASWVENSPSSESPDLYQMRRHIGE